MKYPLLALLASGAAHGYELKQSFDSRFGTVWPPINIGQVYTTLARLERDGLIRGIEVDQTSNRPTKNVYEVTEPGRVALTEWLLDSAPGPRLRDGFFMKVMLAGMANLADPLDLLERQRLVFLQELRDLNDLATRRENGAQVIQLLIEGATLHLESDLKWLDRCEDRIREGLEP